MKMIQSSVAGVYDPDGQLRYSNSPFNAELIVHIELCERTTSEIGYPAYYGIIFNLVRTSLNWYYPDKLTRDNRLAEILQFLETKTF